MLSRRAFLLFYLPSPSTLSLPPPHLSVPSPHYQRVYLLTSPHSHSHSHSHLSPPHPTTPNSLKNLNDEAARRLLELSKFDKDCADTIFWLRSNRHLFRMEIFEPAIVSLTVPDRRYASAVEACFSAAQLRVCAPSFLFLPPRSLLPSWSSDSECIVWLSDILT